MSRPYPYKLEETRKLLKSPDTYAFTLMCIILSKYDAEEVLEEEDTSVIFKNIEDDFNVHIPEEVENRINAAITVLTSDLPLISFPVFKSVALAFAEGQIGDEDDREDEELNTCELLWTLYEIAILTGRTVPEVQEELSESVVEELNNIIDSEAEDQDDDYEEENAKETKEEGLEDINEIARDPYYNRYVRASMDQLVRQLKKLGVAPETCLEILTTFRGIRG